MISKFRMNQVIKDNYHDNYCRRCQSDTVLGRHIALECPSLSRVRKNVGLLVTLHLAMLSGSSVNDAYLDFLSGVEVGGGVDGKIVCLRDVLDRGAMLDHLLNDYYS